MNEARTATPPPTTRPITGHRTTNRADATTTTPRNSGSMKAIIQDRYGTPDVLRYGVTERPTPAADEVLVQVEAAGIDRGTCHLLTGTPYPIRLAGYGLIRPKNRIPGLDVAGRVVAVGADVTRFTIGDEVFGIAKGSMAQFTVAAEDKLAHKPASLSFERAAVSAVSGITALQALVDVGQVKPGQDVLIIGASGGVGSFAVQLAKALGATVTAVAGTNNLELVASLGADYTVDHREQDFIQTATRYDLVLDIGGRNSISRLRSVMAPDATLVMVGGEDANRVTGGLGRQLRAVMLSPLLSQRLTMLVSKEHHSSIEQLLTFMDAGAVTPAIQNQVPLADAAVAIDDLNSGRASGKTAILVGSTADGHAA